MNDAHSDNRPWSHPRNGILLNPMLIGIAAGTAVVLAVKYRKELRPYFRLALRECYAFRDWFFENAEEVRTEGDDLVAEAKENLATQIAHDLESIERERTILKRMENFMKTEGTTNV